MKNINRIYVPFSRSTLLWAKIVWQLTFHCDVQDTLTNLYNFGTFQHCFILNTNFEYSLTTQSHHLLKQWPVLSKVKQNHLLTF